MLLIDSDVLIDILRGHQPAINWFKTLEELPAVPGLVVMELIQDAENKARIDWAMKLVEPLTVVWPTHHDCDRALSFFKSFHLSHGLGLLDALIGSCAIGQSADLCTFNLKHYKVLSELRTIQPYSR